MSRASVIFGHFGKYFLRLLKIVYKLPAFMGFVAEQPDTEGVEHALENAEETG
ncbi:MAG TPA: hypothetical protein PLP16_09530 [Smithellaceae bacterium]|jgi:hypothetical protein|nr:hypothetical protein [Smithellaceae bacterium]